MVQREHIRDAQAGGFQGAGRETFQHGDGGGFFGEPDACTGKYMADAEPVCCPQGGGDLPCFSGNESYNDLFYRGRFDFVVYERQGKRELPMLAIELDGKEHLEDEAVRIRDKKKDEICREHDLQLIRVENSYARRYNHIKEILIRYFLIGH